MMTKEEFDAQVEAAKTLFTTEIDDTDLQQRYDDLMALRQLLDQRLNQLDSRLHPVSSKNLVNPPAFEKIGSEKTNDDDSDGTNVMMVFLKN